MRRVICLSLFAFISSFATQAAPGDTTFVQAQSTVQMPYYGNYDTTVLFPDGSKTYRKILMTFTLGKYHCPTGSTYCGDWDYTVLMYVMNKRGDTMEIARMITPYGNASYNRFPWSLQQRYYYDVTDYASILQDSGTVHILYSGYSGGFTADIKFAFIEGTPERNVLKIRRLWRGTFGYGSATNPINNHFPPIYDVAPAGAQDATMRFLVTGHGSDSAGCCEFASHYYDLTVNGTTIERKYIWRPDCGDNELYPQSGTWLSQRANWCPGALVRTNFHHLTGFIAGGTNTLSLAFEPYFLTSPSGVYTTEAALVYYGGLNKNLDASLEDIVAPTNYEGYYRENPACGKPTIHIRNSGITTIDSVSIQYGVQGHTIQTYTWKGTLRSLRDTIISLPDLKDLESLAGDTTMHTFTAIILNVNGVVDADNTNNSLTSHFLLAPVWVPSFIVRLKTNGSAVSGTTSETEWRIYDVNNNVVAEHVGLQINTTYADTVTLPKGGYRLVVTDAGCDGISYWAYSYYVPNPGNGTMTVLQNGPVYHFAIPIPSEQGGDFGCGFSQYFVVASSLDVNNISSVNGYMSIEAYPNPASSQVTVSLTGMNMVDGDLQIVDALGRVVAEKKCNSTKTIFNTANLANGMYTIVYADNNQNNRTQTRLIIAK